jgi:hypothetical protein
VSGALSKKTCYCYCYCYCSIRGKSMSTTMGLLNLFPPPAACGQLDAIIAALMTQVSFRPILPQRASRSHLFDGGDPPCPQHDCGSNSGGAAVASAAPSCTAGCELGRDGDWDDGRDDGREFVLASVVELPGRERQSSGLISSPFQPPTEPSFSRGCLPFWVRSIRDIFLLSFPVSSQYATLLSLYLIFEAPRSQ